MSSTDDPTSDDRFDTIDKLARRAVDSVMTLARRGLAFGGGVLMITAVLCIGGLLLGIAALSGGMETLWIILGGFFATLAIGGVILALVRLASVRRHEDELYTEVRAMLGRDPGAQRTVIETVEVTDAVQDQSVVVASRQFYTMRENLGGEVPPGSAMSRTLAAITTLPLLMLMATFITMVFAGLGLLFLIGLAL